MNTPRLLIAALIASASGAALADVTPGAAIEEFSGGLVFNSGIIAGYGPIVQSDGFGYVSAFSSPINTGAIGATAQLGQSGGAGDGLEGHATIINTFAVGLPANATATARFTFHGSALAANGAAAILDAVVFDFSNDLRAFFSVVLEPALGRSRSADFTRTLTLKVAGGDQLFEQIFVEAASGSVSNRDLVSTGPGYANAYLDPSVSYNAVPEPALAGLLGLGVIGIMAQRRRSAG